MLIREGPARNDRIDLWLAVLLSAIAGALNSTGFFAFSLFSANMTGNASSASDYLALGEIFPALSFLAIILVFITGAFAASAAIDMGRRRERQWIYALVLCTEGIALVVLGVVGLYVSLSQLGFQLVLILAFLMGAQNALTTKISSGRVRTTHVSGMATDMGISLAALAYEPAARRRLILFGCTMLAFIAGGVAGVLLYQSAAMLPFLSCGLILIVAAFSGFRHPAT